MNTANNLRKLPDYTQLDLFQADFNDIAIRSLREVMERPFFALTNNRPRFEPIIYRTDDAEVIISGGKPDGIATIFDNDILMWIISQIVEAKDKGKPTSPQIDFAPYKCLSEIYRDTGGRRYELLAKAIRRLSNTHIRTSIRKKDQIPLSRKEKHRLEVGFNWLESYGIHYEERGGKERMKGITAVIPNWLYQGALKKGGVLTIDERYFVMKSGLERVLYMIARKHVGNQREGWTISMENLYQKTGSETPLKVFAHRIRKMAERDPLPEYTMSVHKGEHTSEVVTFWKRSYLDYADYRYEGKRTGKNQALYTNEEHRAVLDAQKQEEIG